MDIGALVEALQEKTAEAAKLQQQRLRDKAKQELHIAKLKTHCQHLEVREKEAASQLADKEATILKLQVNPKPKP